MGRLQVGDTVSFRAVIKLFFSNSQEPYRVIYGEGDKYTDLTLLQVLPLQGTLPVNEEEYEEGQVVELIPHLIFEIKEMFTIRYGKQTSYHLATLIAKVDGWGDQRLYIRDIDKSIFHLIV